MPSLSHSGSDSTCWAVPASSPSHTPHSHRCPPPVSGSNNPISGHRWCCRPADALLTLSNDQYWLVLSQPRTHIDSVLTLFRLWHPAPHTPKSMTSSPHWVSDTSAQETPYPAVALMAYTTASATLPLDALLTRTPPTLRMLIMAFGLKCLEREGMWREGAERKEEENHCSFYYLKMAQGGAGALCALLGQPALSVKSKPLQVF